MDQAALSTAITLFGVVFVAIAVAGAGVMGLSEFITVQRRRARLTDGVSAVGGAGDYSLAHGLAQPIRKLGDRIVVRDPAQLSQVRAKLTQAGFSGPEAVPLYLGVRMVCVIAAIVGTLFLLPWAMSRGGGLGASGLALMLVIAAMLGPDRVLATRQKKREREYREGFPDFLDLLVASVEAGLSLDAGVTRVQEEMGRRYPNLAQQLGMLTLELRAGKSRKEAWSGLATRLGIDEARSLSTMLRQAEEMGTSLGDTLAIFSEDMRSKRMLRAEEKAMALPAKLMIPLILFIFPCLLGVIILPAAYRISQSMVGGG